MDSVGQSPLLSVLILMLRMFQIWLVTGSSFRLASVLFFGYIMSFFEHIIIIIILERAPEFILMAQDGPA